MQQETHRVLRPLSTDVFASDLAASELCGDFTALSAQSVDVLAQTYRRVMTTGCDEGAV